MTAFRCETLFSPLERLLSLAPQYDIRLHPPRPRVRLVIATAINFVFRHVNYFVVHPGLYRVDPLSCAAIIQAWKMCSLEIKALVVVQLDLSLGCSLTSSPSQQTYIQRQKAEWREDRMQVTVAHSGRLDRGEGFIWLPDVASLPLSLQSN